MLAADGLRIVGEAKNIGPGISRDLVVLVQPGDYFTVCKPGIVGEGVGKTAFTVTDSGTDQFADAYIAGDDETAGDLYAPTRVFWERGETVTESFGGLDPRMALREADLDDGQEWTDWHAIEKDLWPADAEDGFEAFDQSTRESLATQLVADTNTLYSNVQDLEFTLDQQTNGAIGLLDGAAWMAGGSYLVCRKIRMTVETWDRTSSREQETIFGRTKGEGAPLSGGSEFTDPNFSQTGRDDTRSSMRNRT